MYPLISQKLLTPIPNRDVYTINLVRQRPSCACVLSIIPEMIESDNGLRLVNEVFKEFVGKKHIKHICMFPNHPPSNGLAEKAAPNEIVYKSVLEVSTSTLEKLVSLLSCGNIPHISSGYFPAEMHLNRKIRHRLDRIISDPISKVKEKQL